MGNSNQRDKSIRSATTLCNEGDEKYHNGDFAGAMSCYRQALEIGEIKETELEARILKNRACCRGDLDDFDGAVSDATKALEITPNDPFPLHIRCKSYENMGKFEDAYRDAAMLIKVDPKNTSVKHILDRLKIRSAHTLYYEGIKKCDNGDFEAGISCYTKALEIGEIKETKIEADIFHNRAVSRLIVHDFDGAVSDATKALEIEPNRTKTLKTRCEAYERLEKFEDAYRDGAMLIKVDPMDPSVKEILNRLTLIIKHKAAMLTVWEPDERECIEHDMQLSTHAATMPRKEGDHQAAMLTVWEPDERECIEHDMQLSTHAATMPRKEGDHQMSLTTTLKEKGNAKFKNGDFAGALSCYAQVLDISETNTTEKAVILKNRAMCRLKVADFEGAVSDATKALEIAPHDPDAMDSRCTAYASLGKVDDAYRDATMLLASNNPLVKPMLIRLVAIIRQKGDVFTSNSSMATGGREEDGEEWASQLLSKLCEDVSFSEEEWRFRLRISDIWSTTGNYDDTINKSLHSGSSSEGLSADILGSDTDVMHVVSGIKVTESDVVSADEEDDVYKAITSNHPAFYMMNLRHEGKGLHYFNSLSRQCLEKYPHSKIIILNGTILKAKSHLPGCDEGGQSVQHGPALTVSTTGEAQHEFDIVISLHCPSWPTVSEEWKHRLKPSGWPSPELVEKVTKLGCEFVATGNPLSLHKDIEWRLSSSAAERVLVRSFNIVQIQSYFLLKLVLFCLIKPCVPESLCSYHMKNIMLWQVEKTDLWTWRRDNLAQCFNECMKVLYQCLENGNLPQYFIPQQNLFYPKIQDEVRRKLIRVVGGLVQEGWICLLRCAPFTNMKMDCMHEVPMCPCYDRHMLGWRITRKVNQVEKQLRLTIRTTTKSLSSVTVDSVNHTVSNICQILQMNTVTDAIYRPSRQVIDILNTDMFNHLGYMMLTVTIGPQGQKNAQMYQILQSAKRQLENNCDVDMSSCRLKLATFYYRLGQVHKCIRVVHNVLEKFTTRTVVLTGGPMREIRNTNVSRVCQHLIGLVLKYDDFHDLLRNVSVPVVFSPWEIINAPPAVQRLAFHRRFESDHERSYFKVVAIDSRVYAYYLMTISYREIGRHVQAERSLNYLRRMLRRPGYYKVCYPYEAQQLFDHCTRSQ